MQLDAWMTRKRIIKADRLVADIRSRVSDFELMEKYQLSLGQLDKVLEKLVEKNLLRREELEERGAHYDDPRNRIVTRRAARHYLSIPLVIQAIDQPSHVGFVTDLSTTGFRTRDLEVSLEETKSFIIRPKNPKDLARVTISAVCRWTRFDCSGKKDRLEAGFEILDISDQDRVRIRQMIQRFGMGDRNTMKETNTRTVMAEEK